MHLGRFWGEGEGEWGVKCNVGMGGVGPSGGEGVGVGGWVGAWLSGWYGRGGGVSVVWLSGQLGAEG